MFVLGYVLCDKQNNYCSCYYPFVGEGIKRKNRK